MNRPLCRDSKADVSSVSPSSEQIDQGILGCVWFIYRRMELRYWSVHGNVKNNRTNQLNEKRSLIR